LPKGGLTSLGKIYCFAFIMIACAFHQYPWHVPIISL